jgi:DNA-binding transcriptional LysR family regulator
MNDWDDIRYFLSVARQGSLSAAAKSLGVNHSTVSRRIQALEEKHGVRLFDRQRDGYSMTVAADAIYEHAQAMESLSLDVSRALLGQDQRLEGVINLTMSHDIYECLLAEPLTRFREQYPGIKINMKVTDTLLNMVHREADLSVRKTENPPDVLVGKKVCRMQHGIYAAREFDRNVLQDPNYKVPIIVWEDELETPEWASTLFHQSEIVMWVDDLASMYSAVRSGMGVARIACYYPELLVHSGRETPEQVIQQLPYAQAPSAWGVWVLNHVDLRKTARIQTLRRFLINELENHRTLFESSRYT